MFAAARRHGILTIVLVAVVIYYVVGMLVHVYVLKTMLGAYTSSVQGMNDRMNRHADASNEAFQAFQRSTDRHRQITKEDRDRVFDIFERERRHPLDRGRAFDRFDRERKHPLL